MRGCGFDFSNDIAGILPAARVETLVFWRVALIYGWKIDRSVAGKLGGRRAGMFLACEPALPAHAGLAATDVAIAACMPALFYHFRNGRTSGRRLSIGLPALLFGLALPARAQALIPGPLCLLAVEAQGFWCTRTEPANDGGACGTDVFTSGLALLAATLHRSSPYSGQ